MKKPMLLLNILALVAVKVLSLDIKVDPGMREGEPSYIYCNVGTVTLGITFSTEPANVQGNCLGQGVTCTSSLYTVTQNTTGALLEIASVDASREEGEWYCEHDADRSSNTISLNDHTISGFLLKQDWTEPSGPVDTFSAAMTLSCTNKLPDFSFTFEDSEANTGTVPPEAVNTTTQSSYDGSTCENGNKFYVITLRASNNLDLFNNKTGVKFSFTYYGNSIDAPFTVDFLEFIAETTTGSPPTTGGSDGLEVWEKALIGIVVVLVILGVPVIIYCCCWKKKIFCFKKREEKKKKTEEIPANTTTNGAGTELNIQ